jgi:CBS domain-containing protein
MKVEEIMNKKVEFIEPDASVFDAIERMVGKKIRSLLVRPKNKEDFYGIISVRDIIFIVLGVNRDPTKIMVREVATHPIISLNDGKEIKEATKLMSKFKVAKVFVKDQGEVIGVVALADVAAALVGKKVREPYVA